MERQKIKKVCVLIMAVVLLCWGGGDTVRAEEDNSQWLCIPYVQVGPIKPDSREEDLIKIFGQDQVIRETRIIATGTEVAYVSVIYPEQANEVVVFWKNNDYESVPARVEIRGEKGEWRTVEGIGVGTSLAEVNGINKQGFHIWGFGSDSGGWVVGGWRNGKLPAQGFTLRFRTVDKVDKEFFGEEVKFWSTDMHVAQENIRVSVMRIDLAAK